MGDLNSSYYLVEMVGRQPPRNLQNSEDAPKDVETEKRGGE